MVSLKYLFDLQRHNGHTLYFLTFVNALANKLIVNNTFTAFINLSFCKHILIHFYNQTLNIRCTMTANTFNNVNQFNLTVKCLI